jgi:glycosyltransferase involved in cell wall biosynthesis
MTQLTQPEMLNEIVMSCQAVREITGQERVSFAFPYNGLTIDRHFLATVKRDHPYIDLFFDSGMLRAEPSFVVNRVFADDPMGQETTLDYVLSRAWAKPTSWYAMRSAVLPAVAFDAPKRELNITGVPISVVIPAYNAAQFLEETIQSIQAQTLSVAEIIVVNDGSCDNTSAIARALGVRVVDQENEGSSSARNRGAIEATQPWIAFADADDPWEPDKIERQWQSLERAPSAVFSFTDCSQFNEFGVINKSVMHEVHRHFIQVGVPLGDDSLLCDRSSLDRALLVHNIFCHSALIVKTDTVRFLGYDQNLLGAEDYDFVLRLMRENVGTYVDVPLVHYRRHSMAQTSSIPKVWEGVAAVARRAIVKPHEYSSEASEHFTRTLAYYLFRCGFAHFRYGDQTQARNWLRQSFRERITGVALILYPLTYVLDNSFGRRFRDVLVTITCCEAFKSRSIKRMLLSIVATNKAAW